MIYIRNMFNSHYNNRYINRGMRDTIKAGLPEQPRLLVIINSERQY